MPEPIKLGDTKSAVKMGTVAPAIALAGSDPVTNALATGVLAGEPGGPWGATQYGDPGQLKLEKDASKMPGLMGSDLYKKFMESAKANRARTDAGTAAMLQGQADTDPYAASRENALARVQADLGHESWTDQQQMLAYQQNMALQQYLKDLEAYEREQNQRNEFLDRAGRTAYAGGQLALKYFTKGGFGGESKNKKPLKDQLSEIEGGKSSAYDAYGPAGQGAGGFNPDYAGPQAGYNSGLRR